jgi:hypothetical protein
MENSLSIMVIIPWSYEVAVAVGKTRLGVMTQYVEAARKKRTSIQNEVLEANAENQRGNRRATIKPTTVPEREKRRPTNSTL